MDAHVEGHDVRDGFLRGPSDCSLLVSFADRVILRFGKVRYEIKIVVNCYI